MRKRFNAGMSPGILILLFLIVIGGFLLWTMKGGLEDRKQKLAKAISFIKSEYQFAEITIKDKTGDSIQFILKFLDITGKTVSTKEFQLKGKDIFLESRIVVIRVEEQERALVFPFKLYSDLIAPNEGVDLLNLYMENNFPKTYVSPDSEMNKIIGKLFIKAFELNNSGKEFDDKYVRISLNMDAVLHQGSLKEFKPGKMYRYLVHPNGGLELVEVD